MYIPMTDKNVKINSNYISWRNDIAVMSGT